MTGSTGRGDAPPGCPCRDGETGSVGVRAGRGEEVCGGEGGKEEKDWDGAAARTFGEEATRKRGRRKSWG